MQPATFRCEFLIQKNPTTLKNGTTHRRPRQAINFNTLERHLTTKREGRGSEKTKQLDGRAEKEGAKIIYKYS